MKQNAAAGISFPRGRFLVLGTWLFFCILWRPLAAEITLDRVEMASRGMVDDGEFVVSSAISADIALKASYKYGFLLGFSLEAPDIARAAAYRNFTATPVMTSPTADDYNALADRLNNQAFLGFRVAKATAKDIFGLPLELSYFLGAGDNFCSGDEFSSRFGLDPFGTDFRGFFYFPDGIGGDFTRRYDGIHGARGTGISLGLTKWNNFIPIVYLYNDFINSGNVFKEKVENLYSGDLRLLFHKDWLRLEFFGGGSLDPALDSSMRGGLMVHLAGDGVEFFAQGGTPGWTQGEDFSIDNMFFLIEPRLRFGLLGVFVTFFYHPVEYLHVITPEEQGKADINVKFQIGKPDSALAGGIEAGGELKINESDDFLFRISPFVSFISDGLRWDVKIRIKPQDYSTPREMTDFFIGVRTAF